MLLCWQCMYCGVVCVPHLEPTPWTMKMGSCVSSVSLWDCIEFILVTIIKSIIIKHRAVICRGAFWSAKSYNNKYSCWKNIGNDCQQGAGLLYVTELQNARFLVLYVCMCVGASVCGCFRLFDQDVWTITDSHNWNNCLLLLNITVVCWTMALFCHSQLCCGYVLLFWGCWFSLFFFFFGGGGGGGGGNWHSANKYITSRWDSVKGLHSFNAWIVCVYM